MVLITKEKPLLESLPTNAKWLLVHGLYILEDGVPSEGNVCIHVTCYGDMGVVLPSLSSGPGDFENHAVTYMSVRQWISKNGQKGNLIIDHEFEGWVR